MESDLEERIKSEIEEQRKSKRFAGPDGQGGKIVMRQGRAERIRLEARVDEGDCEGGEDELY